MTFAVNVVVVAGFVAWKQIVPQLDWLLAVPLLRRALRFMLGVALILATLFVRFRDMGQVWELGLQLLFYASPIIYPVRFLPPLARDLAFLFPFTQVMQDVRALVLYPDLPANTITAADAFGPSGRLLPIAIALATLRLRPAALQARGALVRRARVTPSRSIEVAGVSKTFRLPHERRTTLKEYFLHPFRPHDVRGAAGARRRQLRRRRRASSSGSSARTAAARARCSRSSPGSTGRTPARCASTACCRRSSSSASASTRSSPRATTSASTARCSASAKRELDERFDDIVAFAELERFVDQKLKNFSSGMQVRLAYSIAIQVDFDILLLDEVLAVGDAEFQEKCFATFERFSRRGKTIVLVTHDLCGVCEFADRSLLLRNGSRSEDTRSRGRGLRLSHHWL